MTDSKTPEWIVEQATDLSDEVFDACIDSYEGHDGADYTAIISQALLSAYERGVRDAEKAAATVGRPVGAGDGDTYIPGTSSDAVRAIRQLLEVKG